MSCESLPIPYEAVVLDLDRLVATCRVVGPEEVEASVSGALERIAVELAEAERAWRREDWPRMIVILDSLLGAAEDLGMVQVGAVARSVRATLAAGDAVAIAATLARLLRVGERSLMAVWHRGGQIR